MGKAHMGRSLKQVIHIPISHSCLSAGVGQDTAAQHPCVFTAATGSCTARRDLLWEHMLLPSLLQGALLNFTQVGHTAGKTKLYFGYSFASLLQWLRKDQAVSLNPSSPRPEHLDPAVKLQTSVRATGVALPLSPKADVVSLQVPLRPIHFQPYHQSLFQETDCMARQKQCHFIVTFCE